MDMKLWVRLVGIVKAHRKKVSSTIYVFDNVYFIFYHILLYFIMLDLYTVKH